MVVPRSRSGRVDEDQNPRIRVLAIITTRAEQDEKTGRTMIR